MKKFLALAFVCAGLTAMAATPRLGNVNQAVAGKPGKVVMTNAERMAKKSPANVMKSGMSLQQFFSKNSLTPRDNSLMKKAPRRVTAEDIASDKLVFLEGYEYNSDSGKVVESVQHYSGGWDASMAQTGENTFESYLYFTDIPFEITVDYSANTAEMAVGQLGGWQWADTVTSGSGNHKTYTVSDTIQYLFLYNENYLFDESEDATPANLTGELYEDGTIYFADGWCVYVIDLVTKTVYNNSWTQTSQTRDTVGGPSSPFYRNTYLMTPTGTHSFTEHYSKDLVDYYVSMGYDASQFEPVNDECKVYMFQYNDTVAVAWNVFGMGQRGRMMYIYEDGTMVMPSDVAYEASNGRDYENIGVDWDAAADTAVWTNATAYNLGAVTNTEITWGETCLYDFNSGYYLISYFGNNVLKFTNNDHFTLGKAEMPTINVTEGDNAYTFTGVSTQEGAVVYLMTFDYDGENISNVVDVANPYIVERTDVDQTIYLAAIADGYAIGKNASDPYMAQFVIPAKVTVKIGDVNKDGTVSIADVTALIDALLSGNLDDTDNFSYDNSECNGDGTVSIADVTTLIDMLLSGNVN